MWQFVPYSCVKSDSMSVEAIAVTAHPANGVTFGILFILDCTVTVDQGEPPVAPCPAVTQGSLCKPLPQ